MFSGRRLTAGLIAGVLAVGGAAGCGSSDDPGSANVDVLAQAADATAKQKSFRMVSTTEQSLAGQSFKVTTNGDYAGDRGRATLDFGSLSAMLGGLPGGADVIAGLGGKAALKAEMVVDGNTLLVRSPALKTALKKYANQDVQDWASVDIAKLGKTFGIDLGSLLAGSTGSAQPVAYMRALTGSLEKVGTAQIDGVQTTHYRGTLDLANIPKDSVPPQMANSFKQLAAVLKKSGASTKSPVEVWVGKDGLVRREIITQKIAGNTSRTTVNFSQYGEAISIPLPPAAERFDALALVETLAPGALKAAAGQLKGATP